MANTMDAAPRSPTQETNSCCFTGRLNQHKMPKTAAGRATRMRKRETRMPGSRTLGR